MTIDTNFSLLVFLLALLFTVGGALVIVGYIYVMPSSFARGMRWGLVSTLPVIITAFYMGLRALLPEGSNIIVACILLLSLIGPMAFCIRFWRDQRKPGLQILIGMSFIVIAFAVSFLSFRPSLIEHYEQFKQNDGEMSEREKQEQAGQIQIQQQDSIEDRLNLTPSQNPEQQASSALLPELPLQQGVQQNSSDVSR